MKDGKGLKYLMSGGKDPETQDVVPGPPARLPQFVRLPRRAAWHQPAGGRRADCRGCPPTISTNRCEALREDGEGEEVKEEPGQVLREHIRAAGWKVTDGKPIKVKRFARTMKAVSICPAEAKGECGPARSPWTVQPRSQCARRAGARHSR